MAVPANATLPPAKRIIRWKLSKMTELGWCMVHKIMRFLDAKDIMCETRTPAECASCPVVGSSRNSTSGSVNSCRGEILYKIRLDGDKKWNVCTSVAKANLFLSPPERTLPSSPPPIRTSRLSVRPTSLSKRSIFSRMLDTWILPSSFILAWRGDTCWRHETLEEKKKWSLP